MQQWLGWGLPGALGLGALGQCFSIGNVFQLVRPASLMVVNGGGSRPGSGMMQFLWEL